MKTKLTLSIDKEIKEKVKAYAKEYETSVSAVVEELLEEVMSYEKREIERKRNRKDNEDIPVKKGSVVAKLIEPPKNMGPAPHTSMTLSTYTYKELKGKILTDKYLKGTKIGQDKLFEQWGKRFNK
jgi:hypothetical protein